MDRERVYPSPACQREQEDCLMFRIIRVPAALDNFFQPLERHFHWNHFTYFRLPFSDPFSGKWSSADRIPTQPLAIPSFKPQ